MKASDFLIEAGAVPIYYFAYGMLTDPKIMRGADFVGTAVLKNFEYEMFQYANVRPEAGQEVVGVLWALDRNMLAELDRTEGYPHLYDRKTVPVYVDGNKVVAELYTMTPATREHLEGTRPRKTYIARIARGYKAAGVPISQLANSLNHDVAEDTIKLTVPQRAKDWIKKVYDLYPHTFQNNHIMVWGEGEQQQFAMFDLVPSMSKKDAVEVKWFQAYPLRQGVGTRAMAELQRLAREDNISLTLYPWDKGQVSQAKLTKFYKGQGFKPTVKGSKNMAWTPESLEEAFNQPYPLQWEHGEFGDHDAYTKLPDGSNLSIMFNKEDDDVYTVEFWRNNSQDATGDGDSQRIFATVLSAIQEFLTTKEQPRFISFTGAKGEEQGKDSRISLYSKLLQRYATSWGYQLKNVHDTGDHIGFDLVRIKQDVGEDIDRRGFLKGMAGGATVSALGAQAKTDTKPQSVANNPKVDFLLKWAKQFIKNPAELAAFMAQCAHESDNFNTMNEYGTPEQFAKKYDIRFNPAKAKILGNDKPGDGAKYHGRGYLQLTGKYNYQKAGEWISKFINHPVDFVAKPEIVATPTAAALSSIWYWIQFVRPRTKSFNNTKQVTKNINPGLKGQKNREQKARDWQAAMHVKPGEPIKVASR